MVLLSSHCRRMTLTIGQDCLSGMDLRTLSSAQDLNITSNYARAMPVFLTPWYGTMGCQFRKELDTLWFAFINVSGKRSRCGMFSSRRRREVIQLPVKYIGNELFAWRKKLSSPSSISLLSQKSSLAPNRSFLSDTMSDPIL